MGVPDKDKLGEFMRVSDGNFDRETLSEFVGVCMVMNLEILWEFQMEI